MEATKRLHLDLYVQHLESRFAEGREGVIVTILCDHGDHYLSIPPAIISSASMIKVQPKIRLYFYR